MVGELKPYLDLLIMGGGLIVGGFGYIACERIRESAIAGKGTRKLPTNLSLEEACHLDDAAIRGVGYRDADGD